MKTRSLSLGAALLAALATLPAAAQTPPAPPTPAPELGQLAFFAGDWTCKGQVEASPMGPAHATQAKVKIHKDLGGFWYAGRYAEAKNAKNPQPMSFAFVMGYDPAGKAWTMDGFDVFGNRSHQKATGWQDAVLVFEGDSVGGGQTTPARDTFTKKSETTLEHKGEMQLDGKWVQIDKETCTRAKK
jgi:hypothetical protein